MPTRIPALTGMRFFLALWVILFHCREWVHQPQLQGIFLKGYLGVDFFFTLSGFILAHVYHQSAVERTLGGRGYMRFVQKRFAKIWPVHFVTFLFVLAVFLLGSGNFDRPSFGNVFSNLFMLDAWGFYKRGSLAWNHPSWSISAEWFAYLFLFPLGAWLLRKGGKAWLGGLALVAWFGLIAYARWVLHIQGIGVNRIGFGIVRIIPEFLGGMWIYQVTSAQQMRGRMANWLAFGMMALLLGLIMFRWRWTDYFLLPMMLYLLSWIGKGDGPLHRFLGKRPVEYLGEISYSMYMVQFPMMLVLERTWPKVSSLTGLSLDVSKDTSSALVFTLLLVLMTIAAAAATYHTVEEPCRKLISRIGQLKHSIPQ